MTKLASHRLALGAGLLLSGVSALCSAALQMQVEPAWNGLAKQGSSTELRLVINASERSDIDLRLQDPLAFVPTQQLSATVPGGKQTILHLTIAQTSNRPLQLELTDNNNTAQQHQIQLQAIGPDRELIAVVGTEVLTTSNPRHKVTQIAAESLPESGDAYQAISALVIHADALARLGPNQLTALQQYIVQCGALLIRQAEQKVFQQISHNAGCNGRLVANTKSQSSLQQQLEQLLQQPKPGLPNLSELQSLVTDGNTNNLLQVSYLLGVYLVAVLFGLLAKLPKPYLLAIPLVLSLVVQTSGIISSPQIHWIAWSEVEAGESVAQNITLISLNATRTEQAHLTLSANERSLRPIGTSEGNSDYRLHQDPTRASAILSFRTRLLQQHQFVFSDSVQEPHPLQWSTQDGKPTANNVSGQSTEPMLFAWRGDRHLIPRLAAGASWQPVAGQASDWEDTAAERMLRARALTADALVLEDKPASMKPNLSPLLSLGPGHSYFLRRL